MARLALCAKVAARVFVHGDSDVNSILEVLFDRGDGGRLAAQGDVEDVRPSARAKANAIPGLELGARGEDLLQLLALVERIPIMHGASLHEGPSTAALRAIRCARTTPRRDRRS